MAQERRGLRRNRLRLRRADGQIYLDRWGVEHDRLGGIFLHKMSAPDPGEHLHDHPWWFASLIVKGGYTENRAAARVAGDWHTWRSELRRCWSIRVMRLDESHRITAIDGETWTVVLHGQRRRSWGFFLPDSWMHYVEYDETWRAEHRDLWNEVHHPWRELG